VIRLGRFQKHLHIPPPDREARERLFRQALEGRPQADIHADRLAAMTEYYTAGDVVTIVDAAARAALDRAAASQRDQLITQATVESEIRRTKPSASAELVRKCEAWARREAA